MHEMPSMSASVYGEKVLGAEVNQRDFWEPPNNGILEALRKAGERNLPTYAIAPQLPQQMQRIPTMFRLVRVFIIDPTPDVPLEKRILYAGEEKLTDATDQELFFDQDVNALLADHNFYRSSECKTRKGEFLAPIRIRDLRMHVLTIASF